MIKRHAFTRFVPEHHRRVLRQRMARWTSIGKWPVSREFGAERGTPIDRVYIEDFLIRNASVITGAVLEIDDRFYTEKFGVHISRTDILHATADNPKATVVGLLEDKGVVQSATYDCIIMTQVLQFIRNPCLALTNCHDALKPGGSILITVPGISQISRYDDERWGDYWRFTARGLNHLVQASLFREPNVKAYGNVTAACAFLRGLSAEELSDAKLWHHDQQYPLLIGASAVRQRGA